jgi:putative transposase
MTTRSAPFSVGRWYHCYNLSLDGRTAFMDTKDYQRFLELLYLANEQLPLRRDYFGNRRFEEVLNMPRSETIVDVGAFCLMPDHFHLALKEIGGGGITAFMRKIGTAYTLYFNSRHDRSGNLFLKPFRSRDVSTDRQFQQLISYVHCTPATLYEPAWKANHVVDPGFLEERMATYQYSSLATYAGSKSPISTILCKNVSSVTYKTSIQKMLREARQYCSGLDIP